MKNLLLAAMLFCTNIAIAQGTIEDTVVLTQQEKIQCKQSILFQCQSGVDW